MHSLLNEFWQQLITMDKKEVIAATTGLISVMLAARNNIWTWPWGIVSVVLYALVFRDGKLFANAGLQIFCFLPLSFYAWWAWLRCGPNRKDDLPIMPLSMRWRWIWAGITVALSVVLVAAMKMPAWADPNPYADGITTALSIVAQCLQTRKIIENWPLWIAADVVYTLYLFPVNHYYTSTVLYLIFLILAVMGWRGWLRIMREQENPLEAPIVRSETTV